MAVALADLRQKYALSVDPWDFRTSAYEHEKFSATLRALSKARYRHVLEIGCGNGELAKRLARMCEDYDGFDAVDVALAEATRAVPSGRFHRGFFPCRLPEGDFDLIVASEILYFLDEPGIAALAGQIIDRWPASEILGVNYLGPSGNELEGGVAARMFAKGLGRQFRQSTVARTDFYRIDRYLPKRRSELDNDA